MIGGWEGELLAPFYLGWNRLVAAPCDPPAKSSPHEFVTTLNLAKPVSPTRAHF